MGEVPKELRFLLFGKGPKWHVTMAVVFDYLGLACLIVGVVASAMDDRLGLGSTNWLLVAIALVLFSMYAWFCAYSATKEGHGKSRQSD